MPRRSVNGVQMYYELIGDGPPLVLVHGSWTDHTSWSAVARRLATTHRVLMYDRRGHSRSDRPAEPCARRAHEDDLAALVDVLDLAPVHVVGTSYGASIALGLASRRPELFRTVVAHEPPLMRVAPPATPLATSLGAVLDAMEDVAGDLRNGHTARGAERFVDELVLGPGAWEQLPDHARQVMVANAPTFLDMLDDPDWDAVPPIGGDVPVLLTDGGESPTWLTAVTAQLAATVLSCSERYTYATAGHAPHLSHPDEHVTVTRRFVQAAGDAHQSASRSPS